MENPYSLRSPDDTRSQLADKLRRLRLNRGWKQSTLAERSGVSLGSLRRFESTGKVSLDNLLKLAFTLHRLDDFDHVFDPPPARTMDELLEQDKDEPARRRGTV